MWGVSQKLRSLLNRARPINRLPPEVLSFIFRLVAGPIKATNLRDVVHLSSICHNWRSIILQDGAMWSNIRLIGQDPNFVTQQLERCRGAPLHLSFDMPHKMFRVEGAPFLARFKQVAPTIRAQRSQVQSISAIIGGCRTFRRDFGLDWPNLEELVWVDACPTGSRLHDRDPPVPDEDYRTPKLRYLAAKQGLSWEMTSVTSLTVLKLEGPMDIDVLKFLQATPQLESLELIKLHVHPSPTDITSIDIPHLTKLVMRNVEYGQLFVRVTFPALRNLIIDPVEYREPSVEIAWGKLHVPPCITTLKMEYHSRHRHDRISITGTDKKRTRSFSLTEHAAPMRSAPMLRALSNTSLTSVTSFSIGRAVPELGVQLPSTSICALFSGLPHLRRLDLYPSQLSLAAMKHLRSHPLIFPVLRILSLTVVRDTCEEVFWLLSGLASDRANSKRWLHRIDCVILRAGEDPQEGKRVWDSLSRHRKFEEYLRCSCVGKVRQTQVWPHFEYLNEFSFVVL